MKYIFRCALLTNFTDNREQVDAKDLRESLASVNYKCPNLDEALKQCTLCIDKLIDASSLPQKPETLAAIIKEYGPAGLSEAEVAEVQAVWEAEAEQVLVHRLRKSIPHSCLQRMEWSVNNQIYGKHCQNVNQLTTILNLTLGNNGTKNILTFELDKAEVEKVGAVLKDIETALDRLVAD